MWSRCADIMTSLDVQAYSKRPKLIEVDSRLYKSGLESYHVCLILLIVRSVCQVLLLANFELYLLSAPHLEIIMSPIRNKRLVSLNQCVLVQEN